MSRIVRRAALGAGLAGGAGGLALAWRVAAGIHRDAMVLRPPDTATPLEVVAVHEDAIALRAVEDPGTGAFSSGGPWHADEGWYGIGHATRAGLVGAVRERRPDGTCVREHAAPPAGPFRPGERVRLSIKPFWPDPARGIGAPYEDVRISAPLGPMPGWLLPGPRSRAWAVVVHGRGSERWEGLRMARAFEAAGLTTLLVAYRNDPGAPGTDGLARFGDGEREDVAAALSFAAARGARAIVLAGLSMGGGIAAQLLTRPSPAPIVGAVLDSPLLDPAGTIRERAGAAPLPGPLAPLTGPVIGAGIAIAGRRFGVDWDDVDALARADSLRVPVLIWHGPDDPVVPIGPSRRMARRRPDLVELREPAGARHTDAWSRDPVAYEAAIIDFLARRVPEAGARTASRGL